MARGRTIIVGGGINAGSPFTLNGFTVVVNTDPATVATGNIRQDTQNPPRVFIGDALGTNPGGSTVLGGAITNSNVENSVLIGSVFYSNPSVGPFNRNASIVIGTTSTLSPSTQQLGGIFLLRNTTISNAVAENSVVILSNSPSTTVGGNIAGVVIGSAINAGGTNNGGVVIGTTVTATGLQNGVVIGNNLTQTGANTIIIGNANTTSVTGSTPDCILIGRSLAQTGTSGNRCIMIGANMITGSNATNAILIGQGWQPPASSNGIIGIGYSNAGGPFTPGSGWITLGHFRDAVTFTQRSIGLMLGGMDTDTPGSNTGFNIRFTNASGTNIQANNVVITAPRSTGNALSGRIDLSTGVPTGSGSTLQTARVGLAVQATTTAGNTDLLVFDVDNNVLERVTVGAADSGGVGFKVLRIPN